MLSKIEREYLLDIEAFEDKHGLDYAKEGIDEFKFGYIAKIEGYKNSSLDMNELCEILADASGSDKIRGGNCEKSALANRICGPGGRRKSGQ